MLPLFFAFCFTWPILDAVVIDVNAPPKTWAVIVAGSSGFENYRHQADACHAYQILRKHGIPEQRIITFMVNDIAYNSANPFKGKLFNEPGKKDVYQGVKIDYQGNEVTPENFLRVLRGDMSLKKKGKKILESTVSDHVFVYFTDHGGPGIIGFPDDVLHARDFNNTITYMYKNGVYNKLVVYIEACYSGSMFQDILSDHIKAYVTTAANTQESSYAKFYDEDLGTFLADEYSYAWMHDAVTHDLNKWTLQQQFKDVVANVKNSHPMQFGDPTIASMAAVNFQGQKGAKVEEQESAHDQTCQCNSRKSGVPIQAEYDRTILELQSKAYRKLSLMAQEKMDQVSKLIRDSDDFNTNEELTKSEKLLCYEAASNSFMKHCYSLKEVPQLGEQLMTLWNFCHQGVDSELVLKSVNEVCK